MHEFLYDYVKLKYCENEKFCYIDTDSFNDHVKSDDNYKDIAEDIYTSNFEIDRPLPKVKKKDCANERRIRWADYEKLCWIKSKSI